MVFVRTLSNGLVNLDVDLGRSVSALKDKLEQRNLAPSLCQRLIYNGKELSKNSVLKDCGIAQDSVLNLVLDLEGGAKKRKKKTYTTPKKAKHKRKKVKLYILNLFSTEGDRVRALCRVCPVERGTNAAYFMGEHQNRYYCGHCHISISKDKQTEKEAPIEVSMED